MTVVINTERKGVEVTWEVAEGAPKTVTVFAIGEAGDVHNKAPQPNNGRAGVFYPADFVGSSKIEIRDGEGGVLDQGTISVGG